MTKGHEENIAKALRKMDGMTGGEEQVAWEAISPGEELWLRFRNQQARFEKDRRPDDSPGE